MTFSSAGTCSCPLHLLQHLASAIKTDAAAFCKKLHPTFLLPFDCSWPHLRQQAINKKALEFLQNLLIFIASAKPLRRNSAELSHLSLVQEKQAAHRHLYSQTICIRKSDTLFFKMSFLSLCPALFARSNQRLLITFDRSRTISCFLSALAKRI